MRYSLGKEWKQLSGYDLFTAVALAVREILVDGMFATEARYQQAKAKRLYYLSIEFLMGRSLRNNLDNLGLYELCQAGIARFRCGFEQTWRRTSVMLHLGMAASVVWLPVS